MNKRRPWGQPIPFRFGRELWWAVVPVALLALAWVVVVSLLLGA